MLGIEVIDLCIKIEGRNVSSNVHMIMVVYRLSLEEETGTQDTGGPCRNRIQSRWVLMCVYRCSVRSRMNV